MKNLILSTALLLGACAQDSSKETSPVETETSTVETSATTETAITSGKLGGTYHNAGKDTPVIIMVPGSGPTDKDGNNGGLMSNTLKYLAEDLGKAGISSVRVDKHGMFSSAASGNPEAASVDSYAKDYRSWVKTVTEMRGQSCAYLLGHSEGGLMVTAAAVGQSNVCGVILVAAPGRPFDDLIREQLTSNPANAPILDEALAALDKLENGEEVSTDGMHPALKGLFKPSIQPYLKSLFEVDPAEELSKLSIPKLVIQGSHDIQVSVVDAKRLSDVGNAQLVVLDGISHVLKPAPAEHMPNIMTYNSPDTPIDPGISLAIIEFVKR